MDKASVIKLLSVLILLSWNPPSATSGEKAKVLYVNSYHKGYQWSDDIEKGLLKALGVKIPADDAVDASQGSVDLRIIRMDTKRNLSEEFKQKAALAAKKIIDNWQPDVVVTSDDNAAKYLIAPFYMNAQTPFVFCGINWDASVYGFPVSNVTGMVEVAPLLETVKNLKKYARGNRIGYIGADELSNRRTVPHHESVLGRKYVDGRLVSSFENWKREYLRLQDSVDMMILLNPIGIPDWDRRQAVEFILANTTVPTGCSGDNTIRYVLLAHTNVAEEQGWWAGKTALEILAGTSPADIPITTNKKSKLYLNMPLANRLGIKFPVDQVEKATLVEALTESD